MAHRSYYSTWHLATPSVATMGLRDHLWGHWNKGDDDTSQERGRAVRPTGRGGAGNVRAAYTVASH